MRSAQRMELLYFTEPLAGRREMNSKQRRDHRGGVTVRRRKRHGRKRPPRFFSRFALRLSVPVPFTREECRDGDMSKLVHDPRSGQYVDLAYPKSSGCLRRERPWRPHCGIAVFDSQTGANRLRHDPNQIHARKRKRFRLRHYRRRPHVRGILAASPAPPAATPQRLAPQAASGGSSRRPTARSTSSPTSGMVSPTRRLG